MTRWGKGPGSATCWRPGDSTSRAGLDLTQGFPVSSRYRFTIGQRLRLLVRAPTRAPDGPEPRSSPATTPYSAVVPGKEDPLQEVADDGERPRRTDSGPGGRRSWHESH